MDGNGLPLAALGSSAIARNTPMKPMEPMKPMDFGPNWWPDNLGEPSSSGAQNEMRYAYFPASHRVAIERDGKIEIYDSGDHEISGVSQQQGGGGHSLAFASQKGDLKVADLRKVG